MRRQENGLTPRQADVLRLMAQGMSNQEIADSLVIDERTVRVHCRAIFDAFGVRNRTLATLEAYRRGIVGGTRPNCTEVEQLRRELERARLYLDRATAILASLAGQG